MRHFAIMLAAIALAGGLAAADLTKLSFEKSFTAPRTHAPSLFAAPEVDAPAKAFNFDSGLSDSGLYKGQLVDDDGTDTSEQLFGAGAALGMAGNPLGIGVTGWFSFYFTPWLAAEAKFVLAYGIITDAYENGGDGLAVGLAIGAKFVLDFPDMEITRWLRPFVALYPAGFVYFSSTEEIEPPGSGDTEDFTFSDVFYMIHGGIGVDFYLTNMIGLGVGVYITGTVGGSKHDKSGVEIETEGSVGVYFEYARLSLRF